ncbi:MAG: bifunctional glutamate N-acetyltransferase/amino-acid acetyltransferase ArgJ [Lachnospiraceae bacterium]|nr:bifunctional glutamate N-acetyltransferase/amino-acid acetyltransferase ArgJ [Lachnospiraceae bacterium]
MKVFEGGVTAAKGFKAAGVPAGIKYQNRKDMALLVSTVPAKAAGTFTSNVVKAAPVLWDREIVEGSGMARAIVVNSGIANACTGEEGKRICEETAEAAAGLLKLSGKEVLVASTGVIGMQIDIERIREGLKLLAGALGDTPEKGTEAAEAIMTTDTKSKQAAVTLEIGGKSVTIGGMCKGSGMIHPNMCTMLAFVTTDCDISPGLLKKAARESIEDTFNMISVDGDTSTNDTFLILANGEAKNPVITEENDDYRMFLNALRLVNETLAKKMAGDGEGATALVESRVTGAASKADARALAKSVITSSLTKAAIFGHDANWGRILCALGYAGVDFDPDALELWIESEAGKLLLFEKGRAADYSEEEAGKILSSREVKIISVLHEGEAEATAWGCDLTYDYVKINADYRS